MFSFKSDGSVPLNQEEVTSYEVQMWFARKFLFWEAWSFWSIQAVS